MLVRLLLILLLCVKCGGVFGQTYAYSNKEVLYDVDKEQMRLIQTADGSFHIWKWGAGKVVLDVYDAQLRHQYSRKMSRNASNVFFLPYKNYYYALLNEPKGTKLYRVQGDDNVDKTEALSRLQLERLPVLYVQQSGNNLLFVQHGEYDSAGRSLLLITAIDSNFQYIKTVQLSTGYSPFQLRNLRLYALGDQLLLMSTKVEDTTARLSVHKINTATGLVSSNTFFFNNETFIPEQVLPDGADFILQGQASEPLITSKRQASYTYLMRLDSNLNRLASYKTALGNERLTTNTLYLYFPVSTTILPAHQLLTIDYRKSINTKTRKYDTELRLTQLDSNLNVVKNISQPTADYDNWPSFLFTGGKQLNVYYEEQIKTNIVVVHNYQIGDTIENDRILQLQPKFRYQLRKAVPVTNDSFVMPYIRNYKLGLVKVRVDADANLADR